jgi:hypothetical protein
LNLQLIREFRLSPSGTGRGVSCDANGAFVDSVPLLKRMRAYGREVWAPRHCGELSADLGEHFGLPMDVSSKSAGLNAIARALNAGAVAHAQLVTLHLEIPNPPTLTKSVSPHGDVIRFIRELWLSGLIKTWEPDKHPRWPAGTPDSAGGQFAPKGEGGNLRLAEADEDDEEPEPVTNGQTEAESRAASAIDNAAGEEEDKERAAEAAGLETPRSSRSRITQAQRARGRSAYWKNEAEKDPLSRKLSPDIYTESNIARMRRGRPPFGDDNFPMELHHPRGSPDEPVEPMTRAGHRLGPNYLRNHPWLDGSKK